MTRVNPRAGERGWAHYLGKGRPWMGARAGAPMWVGLETAHVGRFLQFPDGIFSIYYSSWHIVGVQKLVELDRCTLLNLLPKNFLRIIFYVGALPAFELKPTL